MDILPVSHQFKTYLRLLMIEKICFLIVMVALLAQLFACSDNSTPETARVIEVIDGDTIVIEGEYRVRYIGIDAPETHPEQENFGIEAWQANRRLVEGKEVRPERDVSNTDKYGRLLRYVFMGDVLVNAELVRQGLAQAKAYPPDTKYQDSLEQAEDEARTAGRGMWAR